MSVITVASDKYNGPLEIQIVNPLEGTAPISGEPIALGDGSATVTGGRVSTLAAEDHETAQSIRILEGPEHGNLTVNPDNTMALVMTTSDFTGSMGFRYEVTDADGNVQTYDQTLTVEAGTQEAGWGQGHHYLLETDENDDTIIETGDDHRKVFVSNSEDALSRADIAALEGLEESDITGKWLAENGMYGADEEMALKPDAGMDLWYSITGETVAPNSNWLLFEKGYTYDDLGRVISRGIQGEDELHPVHITSWGDGEKPIILSQVAGFQRDSDNVVFSDIHLQGGVMVLLGENMLFEDMTITKNGFNLQNIDHFTIRDSSIHDIYKDEPEDGESWHPFTNRIAGVFSAKNEGLLIEGTLFAQIAWEQGYDPDGDGDSPQPPNAFSHNLYLTDNALDVTFRDNITTHAASYGLQARGGAFIEDNLIGETNAGIVVTGGNFNGNSGFLGNYTLSNGNVVTAATYHLANQIGATSRGFYDHAMDSTLIDNIVTHLFDPNEPEEIALKTHGDQGLYIENRVAFDNTIVYNWLGSVASVNELEQNTEGLDTDVLDATTYNTLAQSVLNDPNATADDLAEYLKTNDFNTDELLAFFKDAFEVDVSETAAGTTHTFIPNALGGGIRWDNRINWDNNTLPQDGDSVDLNGNWVHFAANVDLQNITFGDGADLKVTAGRLDVEDTATVGDGSATLNIDDAGQFWTNGVAAGDDLNVDVDGGRFANTGEISGGVSFDISDGQVLLATDGASLTLEAGDMLEITGTQAKVGFDGEDRLTAGLYLKEGATLSFVADDQGLETIEEFRSGGLGDTPEVHSTVDLGQSGLQIDVTEIAGDISDSLLIDVDELLGTFDTIALVGLG
ncbi:MAG: Ig-like domain-containing protein, partial [Pseudomonadota bacterium]